MASNGVIDYNKDCGNILAELGIIGTPKSKVRPYRKKYPYGMLSSTKKSRPSIEIHHRWDMSTPIYT